VIYKISNLHYIAIVLQIRAFLNYYPSAKIKATKFIT